MLYADYLIFVVLSVVVVCWFIPQLKFRASILWCSALIGLAVSLLGVMNFRAQHGISVIVFGLLLLILTVAKMRKGSGSGKYKLSGIFIWLLSALAALPIYFFPITDLPAVSGEHMVGARHFELADTSRLGVLAAEEDEPRRLQVKVWYPAEDVSDIEVNSYLTDQEVEHMITGMGESMGAPFLFQYLKHVQANSYMDAPLLRSSKRFPVIIYSHGFGMFAGQNTALMEELASHGYIVYSIQHTYNSMRTVFSNGDVIGMDPALLAQQSDPDANVISEAQKNAFAGKTFSDRLEGTLQHMESLKEKGDLAFLSGAVWLSDRQFVMDKLESGEVPDSVKDLALASDMSNTGQIGMSFGGSTTGGLCMVDARCAAAVNMDGGDFHGTPLLKNIPVPFLMMYSDPENVLRSIEGSEDVQVRGFNDFSYERPELAGLREDVHRLIVNGASHSGYSDLSLFVRGPIKTAMAGNVDAEDMVQLQNDFVLGFFDKYLLGEDVDFPQSQFEKHSQYVQKNDIRDVSDWWVSENPKDRVERVIIETDLGDIEIALYPEKAPAASAQLLAYIDETDFQEIVFNAVTLDDSGAFFHLNSDAPPSSGVKTDLGESDPKKQLNYVRVLLTAVLPEDSNKIGTAVDGSVVSFACDSLSVANTGFFIGMISRSTSDKGCLKEHFDESDYSAFGRVIRGIGILDKVKSQAVDTRESGNGYDKDNSQGAIEILRVYRV